MEDGFQILVYVAAFVIWIVTSLQKAKKKQKPKRKVVPTSQPQPSMQQYEPTSGGRAVNSKKEQLQEKIEDYEKKIEAFLGDEKDRKLPSKTFLDETPYRDSIEYQQKREVKSAKKKQIVEKKKNPELENSGIDWKKAVVYSEILRSRF